MPCLQHILVGAFFLSCVVDAVIVRYQKDSHNGVEANDGGQIECRCENGMKRQTFISRQFAVDMLEDNLTLDSCAKDANRGVCDLMASCRNCSLHLVSCSLPSEIGRNNCYKVTYHFSDDHLKSNYFEIEKINRNSSFVPENHGLSKRNVKACGHPTSMKTADIACHSTPTLVKCTQFCIFGHTLRDGTIKKMSCHTKDNKWTPSGFSECQPFVDCTLRLVAPGSLDCYTGTAKQPPNCYVRCDKYEDKEGVPKRGYECTVDGSWSKSLPYCVQPGSGIALAPKPHKISSYSEMDSN